MKAFATTLVVIGLIFACGVEADSLKDLCQGVVFDVLAHPDSTNQFVVCAYGEPEVRSCQSTYCFDTTSKTCTVAACTPQTPIDKNTVKAYCRNIDQPERVPSVDCGHFWICLGELDPVYVTCPRGQHFSRSEQQCMSPALAKCMTQEKLCATDSATYASNNCGEYFACENKELVRRSCAYGQAYSEESAKCVADASHACSMDSQPDCQDPANANVYFSHSDCSKFYVCIQTQVYEGKCADGYGFDSQSSNCKRGYC